MYLEKFFAYRDPYDAKRDPIINVAPVHLPRYPLYSICWHYYAPALRSAALAGGAGTVRTKWDALRWRAVSGSEIAGRVLEAAEAEFAGPVNDIAARCAADVEDVARELGGADDPWTVIEAQLAASLPSEVERLCLVVFSGRMVTGRWRFYTEVPDGYDLPAILHIDRGHINSFLVGPLLHGDGPATLLQYAPDAEAHAQSMEYLMAQYKATDINNPRDIFARLDDHYWVVREAMERWYADLATGM